MNVSRSLSGVISSHNNGENHYAGQGNNGYAIVLLSLRVMEIYKRDTKYLGTEISAFRSDSVNDR